MFFFAKFKTRCLFWNGLPDVMLEEYENSYKHRAIRHSYVKLYFGGLSFPRVATTLLLFLKLQGHCAK